MGGRFWLAGSFALALAACSSQGDDGAGSDAASGDATAVTDSAVGTADARDATQATGPGPDGEGPDVRDATQPDARGPDGNVGADAQGLDGTVAADARADADASPADVVDAGAGPRDGTVDAQDASGDGMQPTVVGVTVAPNIVETSLGCGPQQLRATASFSDGTSLDVTSVAQWDASSTNVSVDSRGRVLCQATGTATVRAVYATLPGTTVVVCTAGTLLFVDVLPSALSLPRDGVVQYVAVAIDSAGQWCDVTSTALWQSSTPGVAAVSDAGLAVAVSPGSTVIGASVSALVGDAGLTVRSDDAGASTGGSDAGADACTAPNLSLLSVLPQNQTIPVGAVMQFFAVAFPGSTGSSCPITGTVSWQSSAPSIVTIVQDGGSAGLVRGLSPGTASISANVGGPGGFTTAALLTVE